MVSIIFNWVEPMKSFFEDLDYLGVKHLDDNERFPKLIDILLTSKSFESTSRWIRIFRILTEEVLDENKGEIENDVEEYMFPLIQKELMTVYQNILENDPDLEHKTDILKLILLFTQNLKMISKEIDLGEEFLAVIVKLLTRNLSCSDIEEERLK